MLTLRYLLAVVAAVAATAAAAVAVSNAFRSSQAPLVSAAMSVAAGEAAHLDTPVPVRQYLAYYLLRRRQVDTRQLDRHTCLRPGPGPVPPVDSKPAGQDLRAEQRHGRLGRLRLDNAVGAGEHDHELRRHLPLRDRLQARGGRGRGVGGRGEASAGELLT